MKKLILLLLLLSFVACKSKDNEMPVYKLPSPNVEFHAVQSHEKLYAKIKINTYSEGTLSVQVDGKNMNPSFTKPYEGSFYEINESSTVKAQLISTSERYQNSDLVELTNNVKLIKLEKPIVTKKWISNYCYITLTSNDPACSYILYTLDGSKPNLNNRYFSTFSVLEGTIVKAVCISSCKYNVPSANGILNEDYASSPVEIINTVFY